MKEKTRRGAFGKIFSGLFSKKSKKAEMKDRLKEKQKSQTGALFGKKKIKPGGASGRPGHKMAKKLRNQMEEYITKKQIPGGRYKTRAERNKYLQSDRYYCVCKSLLSKKKIA